MEGEHETHPDDGHQGSDEEKKDERKNGRRKIKIELIEDKSRRHITFSKRKLGIMKKAWELATLTGTQVLLLVASETGHVYTFATPKLQPLITKSEGKNLIQACLNAPDQGQQPQQAPPQGQQQAPQQQQQPQQQPRNARTFEQQQFNEGGQAYPAQYGYAKGGYFTGAAAGAGGGDGEQAE